MKHFWLSRFLTYFRAFYWHLMKCIKLEFGLVVMVMFAWVFSRFILLYVYEYFT